MALGDGLSRVYSPVWSVSGTMQKQQRQLISPRFSRCSPRQVCHLNIGSGWSRGLPTYSVSRRVQRSARHISQRETRERCRKSLTLTLGTPEYMAPEQFAGTYDVRSEVYALGVTLYEMLTLKPAFRGRHRSEVMQKVQSQRFEPLARVCPDVPLDLSKSIQLRIPFTELLLQLPWKEIHLHMPGRHCAYD